MVLFGCVGDNIAAVFHAKIWGKPVYSASLEEHVCLFSLNKDREKVMLEGENVSLLPPSQSLFSLTNRHTHTYSTCTYIMYTQTCKQAYMVAHMYTHTHLLVHTSHMHRVIFTSVNTFSACECTHTHQCTHTNRSTNIYIMYEFVPNPLNIHMPSHGHTHTYKHSYAQT